MAAGRPTRKTAKKRTKQLRARFNAAHVEGMRALREHDYDSLGDAIAKERRVLQAQADLIEQQRQTAEALARRLSAIIPKARKKAKKKPRRLR